MKGVIYARESEDDQKKAPPIERQIEIGKAWFLANGHELLRVYADNGYSGGDWNRPDFNKLLEEAKEKQFEFVWSWAHDRIARDTEQFLSFPRRLTEAGIKLFIHGSGWISMDNTGDKAKNIAIAMSADIFRMVTSDKIKAAYQAKKRIAEAKGEKVNWGRGCVPDALKNIVYGIVMANPKLGYRKIAAKLPTYKYKVKVVKEGVTVLEEREKQPSYIWVKNVLDAKRKEQEAAKSNEGDLK